MFYAGRWRLYPQRPSMRAFFGPGGRLAASLPGFEPRAEQAALAQEVADALERGEHLLAEAGTGTGKSLAYLIPALASGQRVVVATATKALQEQLLTKDVPLAAAALGREVDVAVLKGRQNYLCRKSLHRLGARRLFRTAEDAAEYERLQRLDRRRPRPATAPSSTFEPAGDAVGRGRGRRRPVRREALPFLATCFSERARAAGAGGRARDRQPRALLRRPRAPRQDGRRRRPARARRGHLRRGAPPGGDAPPPGSAGGSRSAACVSCAATSSARAARPKSPCPRGALDASRPRGEELLAGLDPGRGRRRLTAADVEAPRPRRVAGRRARAARRGAAGRRRGPRPARAPRARRRGRLGACLAVEDEDSVSWAEQGALAWAPVDVSDTLREILWERGAVSILVSATLEPRFLRGRIGLDEAREVSLPSPYDYREQALLYVPRASPSRARPATTPGSPRRSSRSAACPRGARSSSRRSYRQLDELADRAAPRIPYPVLIQGDAPRERLLERFRDEVDSVLIATQTFWQGVDIQGESLSLLVIDKLPFAAPGDPLIEARCERIVRGGGDWFAEYALPSAILQLRQGFGRLIRGHSDQGVVAILDPRLRTRGYGAGSSRRFRPLRSSQISAPWPSSSARASAQPPDTFFNPVAKKDRVPTPPKRPVQAPKAYKSEDSPRRTQWIFIGVAALILVVAAGIGIGFIMSSGGDSGDGGGINAAGCTFKTFDALEAGHVDKLPEGYKYNSIPATSGLHNPTTAIWNLYDQPVPQINYVHNLEHGGIVIQYGSEVPDAEIAKLGDWYQQDTRGLVIAPLDPEMEEEDPGSRTRSWPLPGRTCSAATPSTRARSTT